MNIPDGREWPLTQTLASSDAHTVQILINISFFRLLSYGPTSRNAVPAINSSHEIDACRIYVIRADLGAPGEKKAYNSIASNTTLTIEGSHSHGSEKV